jgi:hypothetical protein
MLNKDLVYLLNVADNFNLWDIPIQWNAKKKDLYFNPQLKRGFYISNFMVSCGCGSCLFILARLLFLTDKDHISVFIVTYNILALFGGLFIFFMEKLQYATGAQLVSFFHQIEGIKRRLRSRYPGSLYYN